MYFPCRAQLQLKDSVGLSLTGGNNFLKRMRQEIAAGFEAKFGILGNCLLSCLEEVVTKIGTLYSDE